MLVMAVYCSYTEMRMKWDKHLEKVVSREKMSLSPPKCGTGFIHMTNV